MQCANHSDRVATAVCNHCGKNICPECLVDVKGENYCKTCLVEKVEKEQKQDRSPVLAVVLSFFLPGLGQIYNGQVGKGILIFFTSWLVIPWIIGLIDAYRTAVKINKGEITVKSRPGCLIAAAIAMIIFIFSFFFIILLAAIAIPNFLRARLVANEASAKATLQTVSAAVVSYRVAHNGDYPRSESDLLSAQPPYLSDSFNNKSLRGYTFIETFSPQGYKLVATPDKCNLSGRRIFVMDASGALSVEVCKSENQISQKP